MSGSPWRRRTLASGSRLTVSVGGGTIEVCAKKVLLLIILYLCYAELIISLCTVSVAVAISVPVVVLAVQVYCPPWDVRTGVNRSTLVWVPVESPVIIWMSLSILISTGASHCTIRSSVSGPSSSRVTEQVREKVSPAVGVPPGGEISTLGGGAEEWME